MHHFIYTGLEKCSPKQKCLCKGLTTLPDWAYAWAKTEVVANYCSGHNEYSCCAEGDSKQKYQLEVWGKYHIMKLLIEITGQLNCCYVATYSISYQ